MSGDAWGQEGYGLRDAGPGDAEAIALVLGDWCRATDWMPKLHSPEEDLGFARHLIASHVVRIGCAGGGVGFLARQGGEVAALYLARESRGQGLGRALLKEAKAAERWLGLWTFQANLPARVFYQRQGFRELRMTDGATTDEKLPDVWLEWSAGERGGDRHG